jgi:hypothetical protein
MGEMQKIVVVAVGILLILTGCGSATGIRVPAITSVIPSVTGTPNSVTSLWPYEFVSVQGTGQIFTYNISSGSQVLVGSPYSTPCTSPSGMVIANISGNNVMAAACYDAGSLLTMSVHADGSLSALGSVSILATPYPGIALDGTNVLLPVFGVSGTTNGGVVKVSIAAPATPVVTGRATLASPASGGFANPGFLTVSSGYIFVAAGSESYPQTTSSTIQVVNEASMALAGSPLVVAHSPQHVAVQGSVAYVTFYDAAQLESIDISNPASLEPLQILALTTPISSCSALPVLTSNTEAYVGCNGSGVVDKFDISNPSNMQLTGSVANIIAPQDFNFVDGYLLVTGSVAGGHVYQIDTGLTLTGKI